MFRLIKNTELSMEEIHHQVHVEIKIVNKEAATKRSTLLPLSRLTYGRRTFEQSDVMLIRKRK